MEEVGKSAADRLQSFDEWFNYWTIVHFKQFKSLTNLQQVVTLEDQILVWTETGMISEALTRRELIVVRIKAESLRAPLEQRRKNFNGFLPTASEDAAIIKRIGQEDSAHASKNITRVSSEEFVKPWHVELLLEAPRNSSGNLLLTWQVVGPDVPTGQDPSPSSPLSPILEEQQAPVSPVQEEQQDLASPVRATVSSKSAQLEQPATILLVQDEQHVSTSPVPSAPLLLSDHAEAETNDALGFNQHEHRLPSLDIQLDPSPSHNIPMHIRQPLSLMILALFTRH
ncbi:kinetochore protein spc7-like [Dorcoceras hygrometricum]|uniref:Kinetochore protein spc7-like n=1 Tax=Dorcoceras hygrometricum TaxID=472368 RepID=A0A2Z7CG48_9LAMI|nr:kinetochore protein spc7-like [Dorcoceras hygrometricum]